MSNTEKDVPVKEEDEDQSPDSGNNQGDPPKPN